MKISFLLFNAYGIGGTIRSTMNLAGALAEAGHEVEIASVVRSREHPALKPAPGVRIHPLVEARRDSAAFDPEHDPAAHPSRLYLRADGPYDHSSTLTDRRIVEWLGSTDADVIVGTRPGINVLLAEYGPRGALRIGQEHLTHSMHKPVIQSAQDQAIADLDAFTTVSYADAECYRDALPGIDTEIRCIPNGVPTPDVAASTGRNKVVVAAGRLIPVKNYSLLIEAFGHVVAERPDWSLRLYGRGRLAGRLREQIMTAGLSNHVRLMGAIASIEPEWAKGAIAAVSSNAESFGMTLVEAMHAGLPVVSTDCPYGPGEIIDDGRDGFLVQPGDPKAFAAALLDLIEDDERRHAMAQAARAKALTFTPHTAAERFLALVSELGGPGAPDPVSTPGRMRRPVRGAVRERVGTVARPVLRASLRSPVLAPAVRALMPRRAKRLTRVPGFHPVARTRVTTDGDIVVDVTGVPTPQAALLLRRGDDTLRVPLHPEPASLRARIGRDHVLGEGEWTVYVERPADGVRRRADSLTVETAELVGRTPQVVGDQVTSRIPRTTGSGHLAVRTWARPAHLEIGAVDTGGTALIAEGRSVGRPLGDDTVVVASRRGEDTVFESAEVVVSGDQVWLSLPHAGFAERCRAAGEDRELWDLYLVDRGARIPVGRIGGDVAQRKGTDPVPPAFHEGPAGQQVRIGPYFTANNSLAVAVREVTPSEPRRDTVVNAQDSMRSVTVGG
ncbi:glycosyltransferase [Streptomyces endophyticus]|uniref:D-inositol 3-phosphate glycosyltransferase n=1 Tax=Streptomyces endophyticus TaxID=714166 RepID=A0ABU6FFR9_9ACTN|nr:glycosyltransferase [Streptomyces endophyticus]MEB8342497.1 glycosyltransferase [Streptomyces endophyticus]